MRGMLGLASHTGWSISDLDELDCEDFMEFCSMLPNNK